MGQIFLFVIFWNLKANIKLALLLTLLSLSKIARPHVIFLNIWREVVAALNLWLEGILQIASEHFSVFWLKRDLKMITIYLLYELSDVLIKSTIGLWVLRYNHSMSIVNVVVYQSLWAVSLRWDLFHENFIDAFNRKVVEELYFGGSVTKYMREIIEKYFRTDKSAYEDSSEVELSLINKLLALNLDAYRLQIWRIFEGLT